MKAALGEPASVVPADRARSVSEGGWWLRSVIGAGERGAGVLIGAFAGVGQGRVAAAARSSDSLTPFDGHVPDAGPLLDPCAPGVALSVTDLQDAAGCPFRFFLKRGLGLRPLEEQERDRDVWLSPLVRGAELHDVYAALLRRCRDDNRRPDPGRDGAWLRALAQRRLDLLQEEMPAATAEILERESRDFHDDVDLFLKQEASRPASVVPVAFEVSFGRPLQGDPEPMARAEPVAIDLGAGLTFRIAGRIDRIDQVGASAFEVIDYKTGGFWPADWLGVFDGGRRLQHALYGLAAVELLRARYRKPTIAGGAYVFPTRKGRREHVQIQTPSLAETASVLADLRTVVLSGAFVHAPKANDCRWCDYRSACDGSLEERVEGKLQDQRLDAYRRLAAHD
jgi:ATP-dependent helicase/nuclease subunit B